MAFGKIGKICTGWAILFISGLLTHAVLRHYDAFVSSKDIKRSKKRVKDAYEEDVEKRRLRELQKAT